MTGGSNCGLYPMRLRSSPTIDRYSLHDTRCTSRDRLERFAPKCPRNQLDLWSIIQGDAGCPFGPFGHIFGQVPVQLSSLRKLCVWRRSVPGFSHADFGLDRSQGALNVSSQILNECPPAGELQQGPARVAIQMILGERRFRPLARTFWFGAMRSSTRAIGTLCPRTEAKRILRSVISALPQLRWGEIEVVSKHAGEGEKVFSLSCDRLLASCFDFGRERKIDSTKRSTSL